MINKELNLSKKILTSKVEMISTRDGVNEALVEKARTNDRIVVLTADLKESSRVNKFAESYPDRFIDVGVAEQVLATVASGMANYGKIPFISSYSIFSPGRNWEQIRTTIALNNVPVKIIGSHAGLSAGPDGASHQALEDIAIMRSIPNMEVVVPCDYFETQKAIIESVKNGKPTYIRVEKVESPVITTKDSPFRIGRAETVWTSKNPQVGIIACGPILYEALLAAKELEKKGMDCLVINSHTIKPLDERTIIHAAKITGAFVTVEEHQINGGLGSAVSEVLAKNFIVPIEFVGMQDSFGETGKYNELMKKYGMTSKDIIEAVKRIIARKREY